MRLPTWLPGIAIDRDWTGNWATNNCRSAIRSIAGRIIDIVLGNNPLLAAISTIAVVITTTIKRVVTGIIIDRCGSRGRRYGDRQRITTRFDYIYCASRVWRDEERACG
jgi:hypothetical protein